MNRHVKIVLALMLALAVCFVGQPSALAQDDGLTVVKKASAQQQATAMAFWTRERIAAAQPMPIPVDYGPAVVDAGALEAAALAGPGESTSAGMAAPGANQVARALFADDWAALEKGGIPADDVAGTSGVYTYYDVNSNTAFWNVYPHKWVGRLTFTTPNGTSYCSATVISNNHIVTAAHCVYDTTNNRWYRNWVFTPAYRAGSAPFGTFGYTSARVLTAWQGLTGAYSINTWARHDVAIIGLRPNAAGQTVNSLVGWAGRNWDWGYSQLHFNSGYPFKSYTDANLTSAGLYLRACTAESFAQTTETLGSGCYYGRGISGGSWLRNYKPFVLSGNVNSVNSGLFIGTQNLYGARFNSSNIVVLCTADGC